MYVYSSHTQDGCSPLQPSAPQTDADDRFLERTESPTVVVARRAVEDERIAALEAEATLGHAGVAELDAKSLTLTRAASGAGRRAARS